MISLMLEEKRDAGLGISQAVRYIYKEQMKFRDIVHQRAFTRCF
jgi:hypothetical protein